MFSTTLYIPCNIFVSGMILQIKLILKSEKCCISPVFYWSSICVCVRYAFMLWLLLKHIDKCLQDTGISKHNNFVVLFKEHFFSQKKSSFYCTGNSDRATKLYLSLWHVHVYLTWQYLGISNSLSLSLEWALI